MQESKLRRGHEGLGCVAAARRSRLRAGSPAEERSRAGESLMEKAAAEVFELNEELTGGDAGDAGTAHGVDGEAGGGDAGDVTTEGAVELGAFPLILLADAGFEIGVGAGATGAGFAMDAPAFFEGANGAALAGDGGVVQSGEPGVETDADQIIFKEETFCASCRHWNPFTSSLCGLCCPEGVPGAGL